MPLRPLRLGAELAIRGVAAPSLAKVFYHLLISLVG